MEARATAIAEGRAAERVWLLEHPPLYTAGTSARDGDLLDARFPVHRTGRGGQFTYHGPGQRVAYVMLDLRRRRPDVRAFVGALERWLIDTLAEFGVVGETREDRVGVWVARPDKPAALDGAAAEDKIAALGIRVRRWVSFHGVAVNVAPDLSHFQGIVPCGIAEAHLGVTSLQRPRIESDDGGGRRGVTGGVRGAVRGDGIARRSSPPRSYGEGSGVRLFGAVRGSPSRIPEAARAPPLPPPRERRGREFPELTPSPPRPRRAGRTSPRRGSCDGSSPRAPPTGRRRGWP